MKAHKAIQIRLYPTKHQTTILKQDGGICRWWWNALLAQNQAKYNSEKKFIFHKDMSACLPLMKQQTEWLKIAPAISLQQVTKYLDKAIRASFKNKGFPKFKKKSNTRDSFYLSNQTFKIKNNRIHIPKMEPIRYSCGDLPDGRILSATICQDGDQWYASVLYEIDIPDNKVIPKDVVGIDLGLINLATTSDGEIIKNPRPLRKAQKRLRRLQQRLSRAQKGSNNRKKRQMRVFRLHRRIRRIRSDYAHKFTSSITKNYDVICVEDLNIKGLIKNKCLSRAISDAGWGEILRQLKYKCQWYGKHFVGIGRYDPSSQVCSCCGHHQKMPLNKREYDCP